MNIGKFSVKNPVLLTILMITLIILGTFSMLQLPQEQFAEVPFYWVNIIVPYPGVSAEDVESSVTVKIENEMDGLKDLKRIQSVSSEGLSTVRVEFDDGITNDEFGRYVQDVQTRFSRISLPDGTLPAIIDEFSSADFLPVIEVAVYGKLPYPVIVEASEILSSEIEKISQVSSVSTVGERERKIFVDADKSRLESLGITISQIVRTIQSNTGNYPGGDLETSGREYLVRTVAEADTSESFEKLIVRTSDSSGVIRVGDLAEVKSVFSDSGEYVRFNGEDAVLLKVAKVAGGDASSIVAGVKTAVAEFSYEEYPGVKIQLQNDSTIQIKDSIGVLLNNAMLGLVLLVIILIVFIGLRNALMTALGIPVTFAITFLILDYLGETFNTNTLFGLVLVLGMIVDHAIVIIENSYRLQQDGLDRREAAIKGVNQVVIPVIAATGTTVAAFLPLMILPGTIGRFLRIIPLTVSIALIASTFEAIVFIPSHYADWPSAKTKKLKDWFVPVRNRYKKIISSVYRHRGLTVIIFIIMMLASFALVPGLNQDLFSAEDYSLFYVNIEMAPGTRLEKTLDVVSEMEAELFPLIGNGEITSITSSAGYSGGSSGNLNGNNVAQITVDLEEVKDGRTRSIPEIIEEVKDILKKVPGPEKVIYRKAANGPPVEQAFTIRFEGDDYEDLKTVSTLIQEKLRSYNALVNIEDNLQNGKPEIRLKIDSERASALGVSVADVGNFVRASFDGVTATTIFRRNKETDVVVRYKLERPVEFRLVNQMKIPSSSGVLVPFTSIGYVEQEEGFSSIKRVDGRREITISADAYNDDAVPDINTSIEDFFNTEISPVYPEIELKVGGEFAELSNLILNILRLFLIGAFLIYLILGAQFNSYTQPVLILLTVPFAFAGVILYLFFSGTPFSTTVLYAGVALAGIAVNDSIVLISFINELKASGVNTGDAVVEAAATRLRPIMLTSLTTIAGLLPTALGLGGKSVVWGPMATTIVFGLIFSTATALLFIPSFYGFLYDRKRRIKNEK